MCVPDCVPGGAREIGESLAGGAGRPGFPRYNAPMGEDKEAQKADVFDLPPLEDSWTSSDGASLAQAQGPDPEALLQRLNPAQREACLHDQGALLILAGPGSGKTRVITTRVAHLVTARSVPPTGVLAITFTNKAAAEMRERVEALLPGVSGLWISTFHSLCARILRQ